MKNVKATVSASPKKSSDVEPVTASVNHLNRINTEKGLGSGEIEAENNYIPYGENYYEEGWYQDEYGEWQQDPAYQDYYTSGTTSASVDNNTQHIANTTNKASEKVKTEEKTDKPFVLYK